MMAYVYEIVKGKKAFYHHVFFFLHELLFRIDRHQEHVAKINVLMFKETVSVRQKNT